MTLRRADKKKQKMRGAILREIYKDNLRMADKTDTYRRQRRKRNLTAIGSLSLLAIVLFVFVNHTAFFAPQVSQEPRSVSADAGAIARHSGAKPVITGENPLTPSQYGTLLQETGAPLRKIFGLKVKKIVIDPGHGGEDSGAKGKSGIKEKDIVLDIAKKLQERLKKYEGIQVRMTREEDIALSLEDRIEFANYYEADLFISIHINYIPNRPINIIETYYFGPHTDKQTLLLAEQENKGSEYSVNDFKEIIQNIENTLKTQESHNLALFIQKSLYKNISKQNSASKNWGVKTAPFVVLLGVEVPGVLAEVTCLSNPEEEKKLTREQYRQEISRYLEEGIVNYLKNIEKGVATWNQKSK